MKRMNRRQPTSPKREGAALMVCLFIIFLVTLLVVNILDTLTLELASVRNNLDYERALYLANAGVNAAAAELELTPAWRGVLTDGAYPGNDTYQSTVVDGASGQVTVTGRGVSGSVTRTVVATLSL
jgi:Tfp pilus assembly protein PilX